MDEVLLISLNLRDWLKLLLGLSCMVDLMDLGVYWMGFLSWGRVLTSTSVKYEFIFDWNL